MKNKNWLNNKNKLGLIGAGILSIVVFAIITFSVIIINQGISTQTAKAPDTVYSDEESTETTIELSADDGQDDNDSEEDSEETADDKDKVTEEEAENISTEENNDEDATPNTNNDYTKPVDKPNKEENDSNDNNQGNAQPEKKPVQKPEEDDEDKDEVEHKPEPVITTEIVKETESINYKIIEKEDSSLAQGTRIVIQNGIKGTRTISFEKKYKNGKLVSTEQVSSDVTKDPIDEIILVGTKTEEPTTDETEEDE